MSLAAPAATKGGRDDQSASYRRPASQSCAPRWRPRRTRPAARLVASRPSWRPGGLPVGLAAAGTAPPGTGLLDPYTAATTLYTAKCNIGVPGAPAATSPLLGAPAPQLTEGGIRLVAISPTEAGRAANDAAEGQPCLDGSPTRRHHRPSPRDPHSVPDEACGALRLRLGLTSVSAQRRRYAQARNRHPRCNHTMWWIDVCPTTASASNPGRSSTPLRGKTVRCSGASQRTVRNPLASFPLTGEGGRLCRC
jgi:hypothetical protein